MSLAVEARSLNHWTMREVPIARMIYLKWVFSSSQGPHEVDVTTVLFVQMEKGDQVKYLDKVIQWVGSGAGGAPDSKIKTQDHTTRAIILNT